MQIDPHWYYVFHRCAMTGSFSAAAQALYVSQSAVSQMMGHLERALGGPLFTRNPRGVRLTAEGAALYGYVAKAFDSLSAGEAAVRRAMALEEGQLRIGTSDAILRYLLMPALARMKRIHPAINLTLTNTTTPRSLELLDGNAVDACFVHLPLPNPGRYDARPILRLADCLLCGGKLMGLAGSRLAFSQLNDYPIIMLDRGSLTRRQLDEWLGQQGVTLTPEFTTGSIDSLLDMAALGLGMAFAARAYAADRLESGALAEVSLPQTPPPRHIGLVTRRGEPHSRALRAFVAMIDGACNP